MHRTWIHPSPHAKARIDVPGYKDYHNVKTRISVCCSVLLYGFKFKLPVVSVKKKSHIWHFCLSQIGKTVCKGSRWLFAKLARLSHWQWSLEPVYRDTGTSDFTWRYWLSHQNFLTLNKPYFIVSFVIFRSLQHGSMHSFTVILRITAERWEPGKVPSPESNSGIRWRLNQAKRNTVQHREARIQHT